ncbi:small ribosomal subunit protein eS21-like [Sycon ciliatum]|uniref:small ribosomal subunit protein eS21-like n=1 Tax=Sycon ciliatum TaxID=27933 RepID=UPI0031F6F43D
MQNEAGENVDIYCPRKCSYTNNLISAKDHASVQINVADIDETTGHATGTFKTYALCGALRGMGEADDALNRLAAQDKITHGLAQ